MRNANQFAKYASLATLLFNVAMCAQELSRPRTSFGAMPAAFEPNRGQAPKEFDYLAKGLGYSVGISATRARILLAASDKKAPDVVRVNFIGATSGSRVEPLDALKFTTSYLSGKQSISNLPTFGRVRYSGVWPGVDVVYYGNGQKLEYDFVVAPGVDVSRIKFRFDGAATVLESNGDITLAAGSSRLIQRAPAVYQLDAGHKRSTVSASYKIAMDGAVGIAVGSYDRSRELVIDPTLAYFNVGFEVPGGTMTAAGVGVDAQMNSYIAGTTPLDVVDPTANPAVMGHMAYVFKVNALGQSVNSVTFYAPDGNTYATGIALDSAGNIYVTGYTSACLVAESGCAVGVTGFPIKNALQSRFGGGADDAFLIKIDPALAHDLYSTYLGGAGDDLASNVAVDQNGVAYVVGQTTSANWPVAGSPAGQNGFIYAIDTTKTGAASLVYTAALGGSGTDAANGVAVDANSNAYVGGSTTSTDFAPMTGPGYLTTKSSGSTDGFLVRLNATGTAVWTSFLPFAPINGVAQFASEFAYVTGQTTGSIVTTANPYQSSGLANHAFFTKLDTAATGNAALVYSTYLGGSSQDAGMAIGVRALGSAYVGGWTSSSDFPTVLPSGASSMQSTYTGGNQHRDGFISIIDPTQPGIYGLIYSSFLGLGDNIVTALAVDSQDNAPVILTTFDDGSGAPNGGISGKIEEAQFNDVPPTATFFDAANLMFAAGVTTGCVQSDQALTRSFCPDNNVTRQEMAAFIVRAVTGATNPAIYNPTAYFTDVDSSNPFFAHIQKLKDLGITTGCTPTTFCPLDTIPRWEMAVFMIRARLALYGASFTASSNAYFADAPANVDGGMPFPFIQRSYEEHITNGCGTNPLVFCPDSLVTRGQMASFVMRALFNQTMVVPANSPQLTGVSPNSIAATVGGQINVTITGVNTNFTSGDTVTVPSGMMSVSSVVVHSATSITATLTVNANIVAGPQALVVGTGGVNLTLPLAIKVGTY